MSSEDSVSDTDEIIILRLRLNAICDIYDHRCRHTCNSASAVSQTKHDSGQLTSEYDGHIAQESPVSCSEVNGSWRSRAL